MYLQSEFRRRSSWKTEWDGENPSCKPDWENVDDGTAGEIEYCTCLYQGAQYPGLIGIPAPVGSHEIMS